MIQNKLERKQKMLTLQTVHLKLSFQIIFYKELFLIHTILLLPEAAQFHLTQYPPPSYTNIQCYH